MRTRRSIAISVSLAALAAAIVGALPGEVRAQGCDAAVFCAGAATGDITPPVTTPMWGYTARQGVLYSGEAVADDIAGALGSVGSADVAGFVAGLEAAGDEQFVHDKTNGDTEGYGKEFVSNHGIHLRLQANAFVLRGTNGAKVAVVQVDLGGITGEVHQGVADRLVGTGIDRNNLMISATHTHAGPGGFFQYQGYALLGGDEFDPRVFEAVVSGITDAVVKANARLAPAKLAWGQIHTSGANRNRSITKQWCTDPENLCNPTTYQPTNLSPESNDSIATIIRIDRLDGVPLGVITRFGAHGTIGGDSNLLFSGDNQGFATRLVTEGIAGAYGQPLPPDVEIVDALINGAQGDQSPVGAGFNAYSSMEDAGRRQRAFALQKWSELGPQLSTNVTVDSRFEFLCFCGQEIQAPYLYGDDLPEPEPLIDKTDPLWDHVAPYAVLGAGGVTLNDGMSLPAPLPAQGHKFPALAGTQTNPSIVRLQTVRIGGLLLAGIPGEPTVTVGRRIAATLESLAGQAGPYSTAILVGLANDYDSYYATPEEMTVNEYEGSFTLFGPQSSPLLTQELARLANAMIAGTPVPPCDPSMSAEDCVTHVEHPNTSATAFPPTPTVPDPAPVIVSPPAAAVSRLGVAQLAWNGGSPSAEWAPGSDRVRVERESSPGIWTLVSGDTKGYATILRYDKVDGRHRWIAQYDVPLDATAGHYRLHALGHYTAAPGIRSPYELFGEFDVSGAPIVMSVAAQLQPVQSGWVWRVTASYPRTADNFRCCLVFGDVTLDIDRGGTPVTLTGSMSYGSITFLGQEGDTLISATVTDAYGNSGSA